MSRVYISSTYLDLSDHRKAAEQAILHLEHQPVGMEHYQADEKRPIDRCLGDVRRCQAFISLIAWRYGYRPKGHTKSITQLEYEEAGTCRLPRMIFLCPDEDWPDTKRDREPSAIKLFRSRLRIEHVVETFDSVSDLQYKIVAALSQVLGRAISIPSPLPYRCNRHEQYDDLSTGLKD